MVKSPNIRHSKSRREPMTIELAPGEVSRIDAARSADIDAATETPVGTVTEAAGDPIADQSAAAARSPIADAAEHAPAAEPAEASIADQRSDDAASPVADATEAGSTGAEDDTFFMGSEAPPQPAAADQPPDVEAQPAVEEERIRHAFGRDTDTALPPDGGRAGPDKSTAETPVTPAPAPPRRSGGMSAVAAGIIGGVITLLGAGGLQYAGLLPSPATTESGAGRRQRRRWPRCKPKSRR